MLPLHRKPWIPKRKQQAWHKCMCIYVAFPGFHVNVVWFIVCMCCVGVCVWVCAQTASSEYISACCSGRHVHHPLQPVDNQLTERQALTLDYSHAEEAALGLAARACRALTGPGLSHPLCTHTQAGLRGTIRRTGRHTTAHLSARLAMCVGCKLTQVPQSGRQEICSRDKSP